MWSRRHKEMRYLNTLHREHFDWFLKADDDTYVIVENLKRYLARRNPDHPYVLGKFFNSPQGQFHHGGAGYVLSRRALKLIGDTMVSSGCPGEEEPTLLSEDVLLGQCLKSLGIRMDVSVDLQHRELFHQLPPELVLTNATIPLDHALLSVNKIREVSDQTISFHYVDPNQMRMLDVLIYKLGEAKDPNEGKQGLLKSYFTNKNIRGHH